MRDQDLDDVAEVAKAGRSGLALFHAFVRGEAVDARLLTPEQWDLAGRAADMLDALDEMEGAS